MSLPTTFRLCLVIPVIALAVAATAEQSKMQMEFRPTSVVVSRVSPGADVYVFGIVQVPKGYHFHVDQFETTVSDDDRDGIVTVEYATGVMPRSVWIAVDLRTGDLSVQAPAALPAPFREFPTHTLKRGRGNDFEAFEIKAPEVELVVLRPGRGVWRARLGQGGEGDADALDDSKLTVGTAKLKGRGGNSDDAGSFRPADTVVAIDPYTLDVYTSRIPQP